jgi:hypothetical protein
MISYQALQPIPFIMFNTMTLNSKIFFPVCSLLFFLLDILAFGLLGWQLVQVLLCFYLVQILACATELRLMTIGILLLMESFMMYDALFIPIIYLVPVLLLGFYARYMLYSKLVQRACLLILVIGLQCLSEIWILGLVCPVRYILYRICVNLPIILSL